MSIVRWFTRRDRRSVSPSHGHVGAISEFRALARDGCHKILAQKDREGHWTFEAERFAKDEDD